MNVKACPCHVSHLTCGLPVVQSSSQSTKRIAALAHQHEKDGAEVDVQSPDQPAVAAVQPAVAVAATAEGGQASPRFKADTGRKRKPWGSSMTLRGGSRGGSQSVEGSSSSRGRSVGSLSPQQRGQPAKRGLSQPSLRLGLGSVFSAGGVLDSSSGQQASSSRSEGGSPRHGAEGRLPSFMDSTRSSQAHMQGQLCPTVADSVETDVRRQPFRPSGVHVVLGSNSHAAEGLSGQTQHAQHGVAELSPHCAASAVSSTFPNSTQSSRARHHGELRRWPLQHDCEKDGELTSQLDGVSMHDGQWRHDDQVCRVPTAGPGGEMPSKHAQSSDPDDAAQMLPQSAGCELRKHPEVTASVSEKEPGFDDAKPPSFMLPTASSLAHTAAGHRASLGKSASMTQI